jgi:hypothetical protein
MLGLVLLAEQVIAHHAPDLGDILGLEWRRGGWAARCRSRDTDALCFGDSLMKMGLIPRVLGDRTGKRFYNLAISAGGAPASYYQLRRALDSGARPAAILVDFFPHLLKYDPEHTRQQWAYLLRVAEGAELATTARDPDLLATFLLGRLLPSARGRESIRAEFLAACAGRAGQRRPVAYWRNWAVNDGAQILPSRPEVVAAMNDFEVDGWFQHYLGPFRCTRTNRLYIRRFLELAASRDIPVFWVIPPYVPRLQERCEANGHDAQFTAFLRAWQRVFPSLVVVDGRRARYDPRAFLNPDHLGREGAFVLSGDVGEALRRHFRGGEATPRWIDLPLYRERPIDLPLEDLPQSWAALQAREAARRR